MDRLLARLERRLGRYAIPNLIVYVVGGMALVWAMGFVRPEIYDRLSLDMDAVRHGEVWRVVTFLFLPTTRSMYWILFNLYFTWWIGSSLEEHWGTFKFNVYYLVGMLATIAAAIIAGAQSNLYLDYSMLLAFAALFPDVVIYLMYVVPLKVKWLGLAMAAFIVYDAVTANSWSTRAAIIAALGNYFLFLSGHWLGVLKARGLAARQSARRAELRAEEGPAFGQRVCAMCGAKEVDGADIRVCSCEKCGGQPRTLCLEHARKH
jgi:membrane associated rhomboid family serine protease